MSETTVAIAGLIASAAILISTFIRAFHLFRKRYERGGSSSSLILARCMLGTFAAIFVLVLSQELSGAATPSDAGILFDAIYNPISMFFGNGNIQDNLAAFSSSCGVLTAIYTAYDGVLYILAPVLTLGTFFSLASRIFHQPWIRILSRSRDVYIFSGANQQSVTFATSIFRHYHGISKKCLIIFADTNADDAPGEILESHAICCEEPPSIIARWLHEPKDRNGSERPKTCFLFSKEDEVKNLDEGLDLADQLLSGDGKPHLGRPSKIYIFSSSEAAMHLIDARMDGMQNSEEFAIRRVDWRESAVELMLSRYPLFLTGTPNPFRAPDESSGSAYVPVQDRELYERPRRHIAIIGSTDFAYCYLKNAAWAGCLGDDIKVQIDVVAKNVHTIKDRLVFEAPGLLSRSTASIPAIAFREAGSDADIARYLRSTAGDLTFILVDVGNELENTRLAMRIREIGDQQLIRNQAASSPEHIHGCRPIICVVASSSSLASLLDDLHENTRSYDLCAVGSEENAFSYDSIFHPELDRYGKNVNRVYSKVYEESTAPMREKLRTDADNNYEQKEYNRQSSVASAIHLKYGLFIYCRNMYLGKYDIERDERALACLKGLARQEKSMSGWGQLYAVLADEAENGPCHALLAAYGDYIDRVMPEGLDTPELAKLALKNWRCRMEHDRWSAYTHADGYERADKDEVRIYLRLTGRNKDAVAKLHNCLVPTNSLPGVDEEYLASRKACGLKIPDPYKPYELNDLVIIRHTKEILCDKD